VSVIGLCVLASIFIHGETWWARYVPQAWLLPLLWVVPALGDAAASRFSWWLSRGILVLLSLNLLIVGANVGWDIRRNTVATTRSLQELSAEPQPVRVHFGPFPSLRRRLQEAHIRFTDIDTPPGGDIVRHRLGPGYDAFWFD
jgi:uncharacterized protein (DUF58 family)